MLTADSCTNPEQLNKIEQNIYILGSHAKLLESVVIEQNVYILESHAKPFEAVMSKLESTIEDLEAIIEKEIEEGRMAKQKIEDLTKAKQELQDTVSTLEDAVSRLKKELVDAQSTENLDSAASQIEAISKKIASIIE